MKSITFFLLCITFLTSAINAQQPARARHIAAERSLITEATMQQLASFRVLGHLEDTSTRIAKVQSFRLRPEEKKAVAQTGDRISKIDISVAPVLKVTKQAGVFMLPELYYAKIQGTEEEISYRIVFINSSPLRYNFKAAEFEGNLRFIPVEVREPGNNQPRQKTLTVPEDIVVAYGDTNIQIHLTQVNWPPIDIVIKDAEPLDSVEVKILTVSNPLGYPKNLPVEPAIILSSTREVIQGFGIQTIPVHIVLKGVSSCKPIHLSVETSLGSLDSTKITLSDDQPREVILRSESLGKIKLTAVNPNYRSNSISVQAVFPWLFLILSILGGLIGSLGKDLNQNKKITFRSLVLGSVIGLIVAAAYWGLGIKLVELSFETRGLNESMVFGLCLIAGFFGLRWAKK